MDKRKWLFLLLIIIFVYLLVLQIAAIWPFTIDDMYISLRYAKHWANGQGLLWNIGQSPVEGYSNFSFVVLAALAIKVGLNPVFVLKFIGWIGLLLTTYGVYLLSRFWFIPSLALLPCVGMLLYSGQIIWAVSGLETTTYQALICLSLFILLKASGYQAYPKPRGESNQLGFAAAGILLALASFTRPEGPFLTILFYGIAWFDRPRNSKIYTKGLLLGILSFGLLYSPYFLWRLYYYGRLFPNPVYCKGLMDSYFGQLDNNYLHFVWPFLLLTIPAIWQATDKRHYYFWLPSIIYLLLLISADPVVAFANRLFLPAFILLLPLSLKGLGTLLSKYLNNKEQSDYYQFILIILASWVGFLFIPMMSLPNLRYFAKAPQGGQLLREKVSLWLDKNISAPNQVLLADSGLIPYRSSLTFIDSYCLNNREMTQKPDKNMYWQQCIKTFQQKPKVIILTSLVEKGRVIYTPVDACLSNRLKTNKDYVYQTTLQTTDKDLRYRYEIYTALD
ncbi:LphB [Legionella beliardensis]|uniref:LphB n=1 Tax=Legionella beliardensis TaxID=91822 RepID=A0A378I1X4_9GAMM|nr:protein LphB [Legionella beliardensis]STX28646.1 LphB [Legionella beliardensis]